MAGLSVRTYTLLLLNFSLFSVDNDPLSCLTRTLNGCYGIPSVHYKGRQGDYYVLVSLKLINCKMYPNLIGHFIKLVF